MGECNRCGECCKVLVIQTNVLPKQQLHYLRTRGLKEDQGFILIPHECQHLGLKTDGKTKEYFCDIHDSMERPSQCIKFHGQKRDKNTVFYIPQGCSMRDHA